MRLSTDRLLVTHVGSLPRPPTLARLLQSGVEGTELPADLLDEAVDTTIRLQVEAGIDIVSDGEMSKSSYATYVTRRLGGFSGAARRAGLSR
jgi:5-methyltetrahydropteroyltriglutamate--homocysteine methyltransferase